MITSVRSPASASGSSRVIGVALRRIAFRKLPADSGPFHSGLDLPPCVVDFGLVPVFGSFDLELPLLFRSVEERSFEDAAAVEGWAVSLTEACAEEAFRRVSAPDWAPMTCVAGAVVELRSCPLC